MTATALSGHADQGSGSLWRGRTGSGATTVRLVHTARAADVPVQYFQSVIAIELAVAGALLWQIRFLESRNTARRDGERLPDSRLRLGLALVLGCDPVRVAMGDGR
jgi:hypothetical protein